ncbi:MAG: hypothetical protein JW776_10550 [Candidatus Lokiarchaeota archaeon]|nr:hypothetical protein [Candidatus Lokiarchaeota archaeon]
MPEEEKEYVEIINIKKEGGSEKDLDSQEIKELEQIIEEMGDGNENIEEFEEQVDNNLKENDLEEELEPDTSEEEENLEEEIKGSGKDPDPEETSEIEKTLPERSNKPNQEEEKKSEQDIPPAISSHIIPSEECWIIKRNKSGFTLPKELRERIHPNQNFALVHEHHQLVFYMINEEDIPKLNQFHKKAELKSSGRQKGKKSKKKNEGPEPEWRKYFLFELEDQERVQEALEAAFYKFATNPPTISEGMNLVIYCLTSFLKNHKMNDSRLRQTVIFFLCHAIELFNQPQLIDFIEREIIDEVESPYLYQICLNQLAYTSFIMEKPDKANEFIQKCIKVIDKYEVNEMYAIMDSFKHLVHTLTPIEGRKISKEELSIVKTKLDSYAEKLEDFDYQVQYLEMLERMNYIEEAYDKAKLFRDRLDEDSPLRDSFKEIMRRIGNKPV